MSLLFWLSSLFAKYQCDRPVWFRWNRTNTFYQFTICSSLFLCGFDFLMRIISICLDFVRIETALNGSKRLSILLIPLNFDYNHLQALKNTIKYETIESEKNHKRARSHCTLNRWCPCDDLKKNYFIFSSCVRCRKNECREKKFSLSFSIVFFFGLSNG